MVRSQAINPNNLSDKCKPPHTILGNVQTEHKASESTWDSLFETFLCNHTGKVFKGKHFRFQHAKGCRQGKKKKGKSLTLIRLKVIQCLG